MRGQEGGWQFESEEDRKAIRSSRGHKRHTLATPKPHLLLYGWQRCCDKLPSNLSAIQFVKKNVQMVLGGQLIWIKNLSGGTMKNGIRDHYGGEVDKDSHLDD